MSDAPETGDETGMVPFAEWAAQAAGERDDEPAAPDTSGRGTAMMCAAAHALPFGVAMWVTASWAAATARDHFVQSWSMSADPPTPPPYLAWLLAIGVTCWAGAALAELTHAYRLAGDYPPRGPWTRLPTSPAIRAARRMIATVDRRLSTGSGCLGLLALALLGPLLVLAWSTLTAAAAPVWVVVVGAVTLVHITTVI